MLRAVGPTLRTVGPTSACRVEVKRDKSINNSRCPEGSDGDAITTTSGSAVPRPVPIGLNDVDGRR